MMTEPPELYAILAEKYNLPIEVVREAVVYFWRSGVKRSLESMVDREIYINKLGSFKIKDYKIKYALPQSLELSTRPDFHERNQEYFKTLNQQLLRLDSIIKEIKQKNQEFRELNIKDPRNIQEQETDLGRTTEQSDKEGTC